MKNRSCLVCYVCGREVEEEDFYFPHFIVTHRHKDCIPTLSQVAANIRPGRGFLRKAGNLKQFRLALERFLDGGLWHS